ncbi:MAG: HD-GYP domain-containing protein [Candidatus Omnitrophota bacterium]
MVKLSDFYKKDNGSPEEKPRTAASPLPPAKEPAQIIKENLKVEDAEASAKLYSGAIEAVEEIISVVKNKESLNVAALKTIAERLADQVVLGNTGLVKFAIQLTSDNYLVGHLVNTAILTLEVAAGMNYTSLQLKDLSLAVLLYDIGMAQLEDIYSQPRKLTDEEYIRIKEHPLLGAEILTQIKNLPLTAAVIATQHHERLDGTGYPRGMRADELNEFSRLVAVVDVFEALIHLRPFRKGMVPYDALKEMFAIKEGFDQQILKVLIERIGVYPIGSWVQLSTNEIAAVIAVNRLSPLRPVVRIAEEKTLDLSKNPTLYIKRAVSREGLHGQ